MSGSARIYRYEEIANDLREEIRTGELPNGRLPSERTLMQRFGVQRNTVRRALAVLADEGRITIEGKRGAFAVGLAARTPSATYVGQRVLVVNYFNPNSTALDQAIRGLTEIVGPLGLSIERFDSRPDGGRGERLPSVDWLAEGGFAGMVLWPQSPSDPAALARLRSEVPLILVDRRVTGLSADSVRFDDIEGGRAVTGHLVDQGHRRIGFLTNEPFAETVQNRWRGYALALEQAGIPLVPQHGLFFAGLYDPLFSATMRHVLSQEEGPTAIVCTNDSVAFRLLRLLRDEGVRVPEEFSVTGYGDLMPDYLNAMELTSMKQPFDELGRAVGKLLLQRLESPKVEAEAYQDVVLPVRLVRRGSTGPAPETSSATSR